VGCGPGRPTKRAFIAHSSPATIRSWEKPTDIK
jgi:hypothetical protein